MIYHLFEALKELNFPGHGLLSFLSVRAMLAAVTSLLLSLTWGKRIIAWLQKKKYGETIRDLGLEGQMSKKGTPTMGGIIILLTSLTGILLFCDLTNTYIQLLILTMLWLGGLGFADDYIKVFKNNKDGLSEKAKLVGQIVLGFIIAFTVCVSPEVDTTRLTTTLPFFKNHEFDYSWLSPFTGQFGVYCTWAIYVVMIVFVTTACSNSVNLTDGLDGLATGTSAIVLVVIGIFAWLSGNTINAEYLNIMYIPGTGEIAVYMAALVGALIGFLWYNSYPAQVFMGDTGSLALGGIIGVGAVLIKKELMLPILCGIFFVEALSVIIQRTYFRRTRKKQGEGVRVFRMTPLHHHFQKEGIPAVIQYPKRALPESKIVVRFWIIGILLAVATFALLKLR
ncbi:MAG: phospho-N-acetylmuramoyl-pentapeptide-transferase [Bacteroidales bacterium]|jgi:phospho-N-acetylmuramoyl-pentapeptide-transferase|nr:phospho-N-acetylmuramoyl-pentapeptide-transferase [Bacteroidales bacterium]MBQ1938542.1 phospho-N-acetylmuramoyl-pentapeptide-transferase [Bacteroidales bacterium]MBQ2452119.1 phospho-N-acetylmuramoyl-pentapeptide-transferase [Bacteroidales bacterium]